VLTPDALTIGFRAPLRNLQTRQSDAGRYRALATMVNDPKRPVQFVFAGKAHPRDEPGKKVLQQIAQLMRDSQFAERFVFVEDYDINVGRFLVQGVDVWLNNPRRPLEASGTSGQKVVLNGGLNLSVLDGWWAEAYDGLNGFAIGNGRTHSNMDVHDKRDGEDLYRVLRDEVIPLYYQRDRDGIAARLDQTHEADHSHAGLALQRRPHGDGLHAESATCRQRAERRAICPLVPVSGGARSRSGYKTKPRWGEVALTPIRFHKTNPRPCSVRKAVLQFEPARPVSGGARSRSGYKTKARWAGSRAAPDSFSQNEPPTVRRAEGSFTIRTRSSGFRRCAVAVRLQTPQRHEVGALQGKPAASGTIRQMQFSPRLMLPRFLRSRFSEYVPTTMELDPVIADRLSLRDGSY
jgi:hypothetical protein